MSQTRAILAVYGCLLGVACFSHLPWKVSVEQVTTVRNANTVAFCKYYFDIAVVVPNYGLMNNDVDAVTIHTARDPDFYRAD